MNKSFDYIDKILTLDSPIVILAIFGAILATYAAYSLSKSSKQEREKNAVLLNSIEEEPSRLGEIELNANEPQMVTIRLTEGKVHRFEGVHGVRAILLYEKLKKLSPHAKSVVTENGRTVQAA